MNILENFIVFEGLDRSGKSTQAKLLYEFFKKNKIKSTLTHEPTENKIGTLIRQSLKDENIAHETLALLFSADRYEHLHNKNDGVLKQINDGNIVICDRYLFSSLAYQSINVDKKKLVLLNDYILPECIIYLDFDIENENFDATFKTRGKPNISDFYEKKKYQVQIYKNYQEIIEGYSSFTKIFKISAYLQEKEIHKKIINFINSTIEEGNN